MNGNRDGFTLGVFKRFHFIKDRDLDWRKLFQIVVMHGSRPNGKSRHDAAHCTRRDMRKLLRGWK